MQVNRARGEVLATINGKPVKLVVTLGVLGTLEGAFGVSSLPELNLRIARPSTADLKAIVVALSAAGGNPVTGEELDAIRGREIGNLIDAVNRAFDPGEELDDEKKPEPATKPARSPGKRG